MIRRKHRGNVMIECAIGLALLGPLIVGSVQYTSSFLLIESLEQAVQSAARKAARLHWTGDAPAFEAKVRDILLRGDTEIPGLKPENVVVELEKTGSVPRLVRISIKGYALPLPGGDRPINGAIAASYPYLGPGQIDDTLAP
jgi:hypothetical protein